MEVIASIISATIALLSYLLINFFVLLGIVVPTPTVVPTPSSTTLPTTPTTMVATSSMSTSSTQMVQTIPAPPQSSPAAAKPVASSAAVPTQPTPDTAPTKTQEQVNNETRASLVNILCIPATGISGVSGSGVIIDSRGVILTNAHIAQYFLLKDYIQKDNIDCVIRTGSPAEPRYRAKLIYLPPTWIEANASQLKAQKATGTGEHDYAFLLITGRTDASAALPSSFTPLPMTLSYPDIGKQMLLAAYPAGFLSTQIIQKSLYVSSAVAFVTRLFAFGESGSVDLFSIGGTVVSQGGSSGGAVVRTQDGKLSGMITTATTGETTGERDLRAISIAHINASLAAHGMGGIVELLSGDLNLKAAAFETTTAAQERATLEAVLKAN